MAGRSPAPGGSPELAFLRFECFPSYRLQSSKGREKTSVESLSCSPVRFQNLVRSHEFPRCRLCLGLVCAWVAWSYRRSLGFRQCKFSLRMLLATHFNATSLDYPSFHLSLESCLQAELAALSQWACRTALFLLTEQTGQGRPACLTCRAIRLGCCFCFKACALFRLASDHFECKLIVMLNLPLWGRWGSDGELVEIFQNTNYLLAFLFFHEKADVISNRVSLAYHCSTSEDTDLGSISVHCDQLQLHDIV